MTVKLLTEHHFEFLHLKGGRTGSSESTIVKIPRCWKSHVTAQNFVETLQQIQVLQSHSVDLEGNCGCGRV